MDGFSLLRVFRSTKIYFRIAIHKLHWLYGAVTQFHHSWLYWLSLTTLCLLFAIPSRHALRYGIFEGHALDRIENLILLLPVYYLIAKAKGWTRVRR